MLNSKLFIKSMLLSHLLTVQFLCINVYNTQVPYSEIKIFIRSMFSYVFQILFHVALGMETFKTFFADKCITFRTIVTSLFPCLLSATILFVSTADTAFSFRKPTCWKVLSFEPFFCTDCFSTWSAN